MELFVIGLLIVLGTVLLVAEIALIPGFGVSGIAGIGAMIGSAVYAFMQLGEIAGWVTIAIVIVANARYEPREPRSIAILQAMGYLVD